MLFHTTLEDPRKKCKDLPWRVWYGFGFHLVEGKCELLCCPLLLNFLQKKTNKPLFNIKTKNLFGLL